MGKNITLVKADTQTYNVTKDNYQTFLGVVGKNSYKHWEAADEYGNPIGEIGPGWKNFHTRRGAIQAVLRANHLPIEWA